MGKLAIAMVALCVNVAFGQLSHVNGFKKNKYDLYEMSFKDITDAIKKYNYVTDMNGADTSDIVYNVMKNPIDFAFFGNESNNMIVSILFKDGDKYKIMFGEIPADEDRRFFDIVNERGELVSLVYKINE
jgi:hypothetical protein